MSQKWLFFLVLVENVCKDEREGLYISARGKNLCLLCDAVGVGNSCTTFSYDIAWHGISKRTRAKKSGLDLKSSLHDFEWL